MKKILVAITLIVILVATAGLAGCERKLISTENGSSTTREYDFTDFTAVEVSNAFEVEITRADSFSVKVTAGENVFDNIKVVKEGTTLKIYIEGFTFPFNFRNHQAKITMPELRGLKLSGATEGEVTGFSSSADLDAEISGASRLNMDMDTGRAEFNISGASDVAGRLKSADTMLKISGASKARMDIDTSAFEAEISGASEARGTLKATSTDIELSGASDVATSGSGGNIKISGSGACKATLDNFSVDDADVQLTGASRADMTINGNLDVTLTGGSELIYGGSPTLGKNIEVSGGSDLRKR